MLGKGDLSAGAEQVPNSGPTMATRLGFGWTEIAANGTKTMRVVGMVTREMAQDTDKVRKVKTRFVVPTEKEGSGETEESGHQDVGKDDTEPSNQAHIEQPLGNSETVSTEESPSEISQAAIVPNAET